MEKRIQIQFPSEKQWRHPNYLLIAVLFLLPAVLFVLGIILFMKSLPPAFDEMEQTVSVSAPIQTHLAAQPETHKSIEEVSKDIKQPSDLRKQAGSFFGYVFDEHVFFRPANAFASHEFSVDRESKTAVLRLDYNVSPENSFSGVSFKTRGLDLSQMKHFSFSAKAGEGKPLPDRFRIEFKDQSSTVRRFSVAPVAYDWRLYDFDFKVSEPVSISEVAFVFEHARVGPLAATGTVYVKDLTIE